MKIIITGSHFTPAQAVIEELQNIDGVKIVYVGRKFTREGDKSPSAESQVLPSLGVKFISLITGRLQRSLTVYTIPSLLKIPVGVLQSFYILAFEKPDVILSFGGYVSVPIVIAAWFLSIPVIIHEQTLVSGLANEISSYFANKIAVSFPDNSSFKSNKTILTGNPIRKEIFDTHQKILPNLEVKGIFETAQKNKLPVVLITGGNQGSHKINQTVEEILGDLTKIACVIHQTGDSKFKDFEKLEEKKLNLRNPERYLVKKWISVEDFSSILQKADLVISRAGINTLSELAYLGVPTLVIPIPYIYKNEQVINAKYFEKAELVNILYQSNLSPETLLANTEKMLNNLADLKANAKKAKELIIPKAAQRLALETVILGKQHEK